MSIIRPNSNFEWQIFNQIKASFAPATIWAFTKSWMLCTSLNLPISSGRLSGWGFRGNMVLYTMANVLVQKSRNSRTWAVRSWNCTIRRVWSSFAQKSMLLAFASRRRAPTRKFTLSSSAAVSRNAPRRYQGKQYSKTEKNRKMMTTKLTYQPYLDLHQSWGRAYNFHARQIQRHWQ